MNYKHSGKFTIGGVLLSLAIGLITGLALAYVYGVGISYVPEVHLAAFATMAFGALIGAAAGLGLVWGHVRNRAAVISVSCISALIALYLSWAVWIPGVFNRNGGKRILWTKLAHHPDAIWYLMKWINHYGTWTIDKGTPTTGWSLWIVWILEAALVITLAIVAAIAVNEMHPYCETCGQWCRRAARILFAPTQDVQHLKARLDTKDFQSLEALGPGPRTGSHVIVDLESCNACNQFHTLNVMQILTQRRKFGHPAVSSQKIVRKMILAPGEAQIISQLSDNLAQARSATPTKASGAAAGRG